MISQAAWRKYIDTLAAIDQKAADLMKAWIDQHGLQDEEELIQYAYALATKYGETSASYSCEMYDYMAEIMDADVPEAIPAETATYREIARGTMWGKYHSPSQIPGIVGRHARQAGADTMIQNAKRDNAQWAWVPQGDTCAFCITLASNGWQKASSAVMRGNHAEHIHQNCDCTFAIAFKEKDKKQYDYIYDPKKYEDMYYGAGSDINAIRRGIYQQNKDKINAQKRETYAVLHTIEEAPLETYRKKSQNDKRDDVFMTNPGYPKDKARRKNCQRCIVAYELRKRDRDVIALPAQLNKNGNTIYDDAIKHVNDVFIDSKKRTKRAGSFDGKGFIENRLLEFKNGARVKINVVWRDQDTLIERNGKEVRLSSSHSFIGENRDGKIYFVDPQTGNDDCAHYFEFVKHGQTTFCRIDDLSVDEDLIDLYVTNRRGK